MKSGSTFLIIGVFFPVLVSEGYNAPFVAIIKSGECHVLRQVEVLHTLPNGEKVGPNIIYIFQTSFCLINSPQYNNRTFLLR